MNRVLRVLAVLGFLFAMTNARVAAQPAGCGEYECTWYYEGGGGVHGCYGEGDEIYDAGFHGACECADAGNCWFEPMD